MRNYHKKSKFEIRSTKFENKRMTEMHKPRYVEEQIGLGHLNFEFVSSFEFRISNFGFCASWFGFRASYFGFHLI